MRVSYSSFFSGNESELRRRFWARLFDDGRLPHGFNYCDGKVSPVLYSVLFQSEFLTEEWSRGDVRPITERRSSVLHSSHASQPLSSSDL